MPNQLDVISVLFFCKKSLLARHAFALFERTTSWRASLASETLTGVTQLKIGDVCLSVCMDVRTPFCTLTSCESIVRYNYY